jgi:probable HAF family extracellular repeat protein
MMKRTACLLVIGMVFTVLCVGMTSAEDLERSFAVRPAVLVDLGSLGGGWTFPSDVNEGGQIVGESWTGDAFHAFLWENGQMTDLRAEGGLDSRASGINDSGLIVGTIFTDTIYGTIRFPVMWDDGQTIQLEMLAGQSGVARDVNNTSQIAGGSTIAFPDTGAVAVLWNDGQPQNLGALGGENGGASGINELGQVVGSAELPDETSHAFFWDEGEMLDLGTFGGFYSSAEAVNDKGSVVGWAFPPNETEHAFLWEGDGLIDLGALGNPVGNRSSASDINNMGIIVGGSEYDNSGEPHAVMWHSGRIWDLNDLPTIGSEFDELLFASAVNERGWIVGAGFVDEKVIHGFLLILPSTVYLPLIQSSPQ